jgi:hypothetical protein
MVVERSRALDRVFIFLLSIEIGEFGSCPPAIMKLEIET